MKLRIDLHKEQTSEYLIYELISVVWGSEAKPSIRTSLHWHLPFCNVCKSIRNSSACKTAV